MMKPVRLYTTTYCPYCWSAKELLERKHIAFEEIDVTHDPDARRWLVAQTGRRTVPQIFIGDEPVGGFDDLSRLDRRGELDRKLAA